MQNLTKDTIFGDENYCKEEVTYASCKSAVQSFS